MLKIMGCVYIHLLKDANLCYIRQLLSIVCVNEDSTEKYYFPDRKPFISSSFIFFACFIPFYLH